MARQIVHDDDIAFREGRNQAFLHPFLEQSCGDRPIVDLRRHKAAKTDAGDERHCLVMTVRDTDAQPLSTPATSPFARQIGGSAGLIEEDEFRGIEIELPSEPSPTPLQNVRPPLFARVRGFF